MKWDTESQKCEQVGLQFSVRCLGWTSLRKRLWSDSEMLLNLGKEKQMEGMVSTHPWGGTVTALSQNIKDSIRGEERKWERVEDEGGKKLSDCMSQKVKGESKLFIKWFLGKWLKKLLSWKWKFACSVQFRCSVVSNSLWPHGLCVPGFPVHHQLPSLLRLMSIESVMPPSYLILCCPLLLLRSIFPSIRVFSSESVLCIRWPKYWSFSFSISPPNEYLGLISFRNDFLDLLAVQGTLKSVLQHYSSKASIVQPSAFFIVQLSHPYMTAGKTVALTRWTLVGKVMSLLFNMLSRFAIALLPRSKCLLVSQLSSPSAVILEPKKIASHCFHCFHKYLPWSDGSGCHDLSFLNVEF